mgnify:FL=1
MNALSSLIFAASLCTAFLPIRAHAECRQALALGLDVSGSVDAREYRLQMDGLAQAVSDPNVQDALLGQPNAPIKLLIFEWSGPNDQHFVVPWTEIKSVEDIGRLTASL